jgi:hypothetical protein
LKFIDKFEEVLVLQELLLYLEFVISQEVLKIDSKNFKASVKWPTPKSTFEVRSSMGWKVFTRNLVDTLVGFMHC